MRQERVTLPIRLVPRRQAQLWPVVGFGFFFVLAAYWLLLDPDEQPRLLDSIAAEPWIRALFPWFGIAFALVGACGLTVTLLKLLPNSPFYHVDLSTDGLTIRRLAVRRRHSWHDLPPFAPLPVERSVRGGIRIDHYTVALERQETSPHPREILRIAANEYGAADAAEDATALAGWLNALRMLAEQGRLDGTTLIDVPETFRPSVRST